MKVLYWTSGFHCQNQVMPDDKADAAYATIKTAMEAFDKYNNKDGQTVSVDTGAGDLTLQVATLTALQIEDMAASEAIVIEREVWVRTVKAKIAARLAPAPVEA